MTRASGAASPALVSDSVVAVSSMGERTSPSARTPSTSPSTSETSIDLTSPTWAAESGRVKQIEYLQMCRDEIRRSKRWRQQRELRQRVEAVHRSLQGQAVLVDVAQRPADRQPDLLHDQRDGTGGRCQQPALRGQRPQPRARADGSDHRGGPQLPVAHPPLPATSSAWRCSTG